MKIILRYLGVPALAICLLGSRAMAQSSGSTCGPVDALSNSLREDLAAKASDTTAAGEEARALYHLPMAKIHQVRQETVDALCSKAIQAIRTYAREDGKAPDRVYLFQVKDVWVVTPESGTSFGGVVWVFDPAMKTFLGGVLQ
jgi:hypothetical protein